MMQKLVYKDGQDIKVLKGQFVGEDELFVFFECDQNSYRVNKEAVIAMKSAKVRDGGKEHGEQCRT